MPRSAGLFILLILFSHMADCQLILTVAGDGRPGFGGDGGEAISAELNEGTVVVVR